MRRSVLDFTAMSGHGNISGSLSHRALFRSMCLSAVGHLSAGGVAGRALGGGGWGGVVENDQNQKLNEAYMYWYSSRTRPEYLHIMGKRRSIA